MENITLKKNEIDREDIRRALKCLEDNGIDRDECPIVLQALGYILTDTELEDLFIDEDYQSCIRKIEEHTARIYQGDIKDVDQDYCVYMKVIESGSNKVVYTYVPTERDDILYWAKTNYYRPETNADYYEETELIETVLDEVKAELDEILRLRDKAYWNQDVDNLVYSSILGL